MNDLRKQLRDDLPDLPRWMETRSLLGFDECPLVVHPDDPSLGFVVNDDGGTGLASVVGLPPAGLVHKATMHAGEVLALPENVDHVRKALGDWTGEAVLVHSLASSLPREAGPHPTRILDPVEVSSMTHLAEELADELADAVEEEVPIIAALAGSLPVAFCYPSAMTETLWDVAIDTVPSHRRRGFAASAWIHLTRHMADTGRRPVWCAVASNEASLRLARKLGFVAVDTIWLFTRPV